LRIGFVESAEGNDDGSDGDSTAREGKTEVQHDDVSLMTKG
jgi:hypothetical protein